MNSLAKGSFDFGDDTPGSAPARDFTFRGAETKYLDENNTTPPATSNTAPAPQMSTSVDRIDGEDSDVFLRIAREENLRRKADEMSADEAQNTIVSIVFLVVSPSRGFRFQIDTRHTSL